MSTIYILLLTHILNQQGVREKKDRCIYFYRCLDINSQNNFCFEFQSIYYIIIINDQYEKYLIMCKYPNAYDHAAIRITSCHKV